MAAGSVAVRETGCAVVTEAMIVVTGTDTIGTEVDAGLKKVTVDEASSTPFRSSGVLVVYISSI